MFFLTNNPRLGREAFAERLKTVFNFAVEPEQALTCCYLTPLYIKKKYEGLKNVLVMGPEGLKAEFKR